MLCVGMVALGGLYRPTIPLGGNWPARGATAPSHDVGLLGGGHGNFFFPFFRSFFARAPWAGAHG